MYISCIMPKAWGEISRNEDAKEPGGRPHPRIKPGASSNPLPEREGTAHFTLASA